MKKISTKLVLLTFFVILLVTVFPAAAGTVTTIDFEGLSDREILTTQYQSQGVTFSGNPMILKAPNYNVGGYPPHSGVDVVDVFNGPCRIDFVTPVSNVGIYYTAAFSAYLEAYDSNGVLIGSDVGGYNYGSVGHLQVSGSNIAYVIIHDSNDYLIFDDLTFETSDTSIPEYPSIVLPIAAILGIMFIFQRRKEWNFD